ncbi:MAG: protein kinase [Polyangiaceae bacterium]
MLQAAEALTEAHAAGIVHRDIKPANLFLTRRHDGSALVKVLDFGISKMAESTENLTKTMTAMGSALYMSPEQMQQTRGSITARTSTLWGSRSTSCSRASSLSMRTLCLSSARRCSRGLPRRSRTCSRICALARAGAGARVRPRQGRAVWQHRGVCGGAGAVRARTIAAQHRSDRPRCGADAAHGGVPTARIPTGSARTRGDAGDGSAASDRGGTVAIDAPAMPAGQAGRAPLAGGTIALDAPLGAAAGLPGQVGAPGQAGAGV